MFAPNILFRFIPIFMKKAFLLYLLFLGIVRTGMLAQTTVNMGTQTSITGCDINIYDDGGSNSAYAPSHNYTLTIYPSANQGRIFLQINSLDIHHNDTLYIYDGETATGTPIAALNNYTFNMETNASSFMASQSNTSGAMTLRFKSSFFIPIFGNHGAGFAIHASCVAPCSPFLLELDSVHCSHVPVIHTEDGYYYLDLCPDEEVHLVVNGVYPNQQTSGYTQNDATSTFTWMLEPDVTLSGIGMDSVSHTFTPGTGFEVSVYATDSLNCPVSQPITFRVRNSMNPVQQINTLPELCVGQALTPDINYTAGSNIVLQEVGHSQHASLTVSDTIFLPDGQYCPPYGLYYRSNVTFTEFTPGATLTSANDILYVRIKMEHSAIEDLEIKIFCPNGNSSTILPNPNYEYNYWGGNSQYYRVNLGSAYRPDIVSCNASQNPMGDPWNYVWSNNTTLGYQYAPGNGSCFSTANFHSHYNPHWDDSNFNYFNDTQHSFSVDSSNVANMTQLYHPYENFNSLVGCPLNGNWYIQVEDKLPQDNGYIVEWELALNPSLMPSVWEYSIGIDSLYFTGNQVLDGSTLQPQTAGSPTFGLTLIDEFGCQYDTTFTITVYDLPEISLGEDRQICNGQSITLAPETTNNLYDYIWNTGASTPDLTVSVSGTYSLAARILDNGIVLCQTSDTVEVSEQEAIVTTLHDEVCAGRDYSGFGFTIDAATLNQLDSFTVTRSLTAQNGCDSIVTLTLTIMPAHEEIIETSACEQFLWEGETYTESGVYSKTFTDANGCDSTRILHLTIVHPSAYELWETSCGPYLWNNTTISESGDYAQHFTLAGDCDSIVTLHLTVVDTSLTTHNSNPDFCATEETVLSVEGDFDTYLWNTGEVSPSIQVTSSGYYSVTASNYACEKTAYFLIPNCSHNLLMPKVITPSRSDGLNDVIFLSDDDKSRISEFSIVIYNRWGELIFASNDNNFRWDSTQNGKTIPNTVYNYVIRYTDSTGKQYRLTGSITVL